MSSNYVNDLKFQLSVAYISLTFSDIYQQIDIAPTLSVLLGLPIPDSSIGSLITDMLSDLSYEDQLYALNYNSGRLLNMIAQKVSDKELRGKGTLMFCAKIEYGETSI